MTTATKVISIETLAEKINGKLWSKDNLQRIYVDRGYNTKKMSTKTYVHQLQDGSFAVVCDIYCPGQSKAWVEAQQQIVINNLLEDINDLIDEYGIDATLAEALAPESCDEKVKGYYLRWHEVKVPINSYGKLALRKRQKVHTFEGYNDRLPNGFIELNDSQFLQAQILEEKGTCFEYGQSPVFS
jgi:hypothetical protein